MTENLNDWRLFKLELFQKLEETKDTCARMETRLGAMGKADNFAVESIVKQPLTSSVQSLVIGEGTTHQGHKKRVYAETDLAVHSAPTQGWVSHRLHYFNHHQLYITMATCYFWV